MPLLLKRFLILLCFGLPFGQARAEDFTHHHHYEYVFFLRGKPTQDVLAQARAALPSALVRHRLVEPGALRQWDGKGPQVLLALEQRSQRVSELKHQEIFDTGDSLAGLLGLRNSDTVTLLAVMIGVPPQLDVPAYIEALSISLAIGTALRSPAFLDWETGELHRMANLRERQHWGQGGGNQAISTSNPPAVTIMSGITQLDNLPGPGVRTDGLRKLGLPDIALEQAVPGYSHLALLQMTGDMLINGKVSPTPGAMLSFSAADAGGIGRPRGTGRARLATSTLTPGPVLRLEFEGEPGTHEFERQMIFYSGLWGSPYPSLSTGQERMLLRALAKAKVQALELWPQLEALRRAGTKVFFAYRMDLLLGSPRGSSALAVERDWHEFIGGMDEDRPLVRSWTGDPRNGGAVQRMPEPMVIGSKKFEFFDSDLNIDRVEDVLVIDRRGNATGGEVVSLVRRLMAETPGPQRR